MRGLRFGAACDSIMPKATGTELIALCCTVRLLAMSRSDRQHGCNLRGGENMKRTERGQSMKKPIKTSTQQHTRTYRYIT